MDKFSRSTIKLSLGLKASYIIFFVFEFGCNPVSRSTMTRFILTGTLKGNASFFLTTDFTNFLKMGNAAFAILSKNSSEFTGNFFVDEELLRSEGVTDFSNYSNVPDSDLMPDFFI